MLARYITPKVEEQALTLLDEWATGQLGNELSWAKLEKAFGYSRQALSANKSIKNRFDEAKKSLKILKRETLKKSLNDAELEHLRSENEELKRKINEFEKRFTRWINNCYTKGINPLELDEPIGISPKTTYRARENR